MDQHGSMNREREIEDLLQRAKASPGRDGRLVREFRQETLGRLVNLAHSDSINLKLLAARNMHFFLADFPDLEEAAIDTIYDLCEDSFSKVRLEGYQAITQVSRTRKRWIKRNVDVLVQLLQSEEVDEVAAVKNALVEHLDMDPKVTLSVLCDQIIPPDNTADDEEISIRKRLRSLVLKLLAGEAKQSICERHALPGATGEPVLYDGLFAAIPRLEAEDLELVLNKLIYALPAFTFQKPSDRGSELLQLLLAEKVLPALKLELHSEPKALSTTRPLLQHCEDITCALQAAPAVDLLQFFCTSLIGKITLQKVPTTDRQWIVCSLSRVLGMAQRQQPNPPLLSLRRAIVDACPYLLEVFKNPTVSKAELSTAYGVLLDACLKRAITKDPSWSPPPHLLKSLQEFRNRPEIEQDKEYMIKIRSLESMCHIPPQVTCTPETSAPRITPTGRLYTPPASGSHTAASAPNLPKSVHAPATSTVQGSTKREIISEVTARPSKRTKAEVPEVPSLLSRLGTSLSRQSSRSEMPSQTRISPRLSESDPFQAGQGFSIKGAAAKQIRQANVNTNVAPSSLLERLQDSHRNTATNQHDVGQRRNV